MRKIFFIFYFCFIILNVNANQAQQPLEINNGWVRQTFGNARISSAYMEISNHNNFPIEITDITTDIAALSEIHDMTHQDGIMRMRKLDKLIIPANDNIILSPEGKHIMLINLNKKLLVGEKITMKIFIKDHSPLEIELIIKSH